MKLRNLIIYLVIFVVVGLVLLPVRGPVGGPEAELAETQQRLYNLDLDRIKELKYQAYGQDFDVTRKQMDEWLLTKPIQTPADRWEVEGLLRRVLSLEKGQVFSEPATDLAQFGLDQPQVSLTMMANGHSLAPTLHLGSSNPTGDLMYARLESPRRSSPWPVPSDVN